MSTFGWCAPLLASPPEASHSDSDAPQSEASAHEGDEHGDAKRGESSQAAEDEPSEGGAAVHSRSITVDAFSSQRNASEGAGGRRWLPAEQSREAGAGQVAELFEAEPAALATSGNAGLGSTSTKLNVAGRGVNPRFSSRTAVYFDGIPIATAPYGRPQLSLFPLSMFSIQAVAVDLHGAGATVGPHNVGGTINVIPAPIPEQATLKAQIRADHWGDVGMAASFAVAGKRAGLHIEYAPRLGRGYRHHSRVNAHGGLARLAFRPSSSLRIDWLNHAYFEDVEIPGGVPRAQFELDRRVSLRTSDAFTGRRLGSALRLEYQSNAHTRFSALAYANWTSRESAVAKGLDGEEAGFKWQPRSFRAFGLEPRVVHDLFRTEKAGLLFVLGVRGAFESANFLGRERDAESDEIVVDRNDEAMIGAFAPYFEHELMLAGSRLVWRGGYRLEGVFSRRADLLTDDSIAKDTWAFLPSQSLRWRVLPRLELSAGWGRSFGPPQFLQLSLAKESREFEPERGDSVDVSLSLRQLIGIDYDLSLWLKHIEMLADVSLEDFEQPGNSLAQGIEQRFVWQFEGLVPALRGLSARYSDTWTFGRIVGGEFDGGQLPWYPRYAMASSLRYQFRFGLYLSASLRHMGSYYTDYANTVDEDESGGVGRVPAFNVLDAGVGYVRDLGRRSRLALRLGVRNLADVAWYSRTDDRNAGILAMPGRTFFIDLEWTQLVHRARSRSSE